MRILVDVELERLPEIMDKWDVISLRRASTETGVYTEITQIPLVPGKDTYIYYDDDGTETSWYKTFYYNTITRELSGGSQAFMIDSELKVGYSFENYYPPEGTWGEIITSDDMRYHYLWGIELMAADSNKSTVEDSQLRYHINAALVDFETSLNINIRKRVYKTKPADSLVKAKVWQRGVDYTDEEMPYDFKKNEWMNYGHIMLRNKPIVSIERAEMFSPWDQKILNIFDWIRLYKNSGELQIYPKGSTLFGTGYMASGIMMATPQMFSMNYPQAFQFDYTAGFVTSDFVPADMRDAIGMYAAIKILCWVSDGTTLGINSQSLGLDGLSESLAFDNPRYGARIKEYKEQVEKFIKGHAMKLKGVPMGFISM